MWCLDHHGVLLLGLLNRATREPAYRMRRHQPLRLAQFCLAQWSNPDLRASRRVSLGKTILLNLLSDLLIRCGCSSTVGLEICRFVMNAETTSHPRQPQRATLKHIGLWLLRLLGELSRADRMARFGIRSAAASRDPAVYQELAWFNAAFSHRSKLYVPGWRFAPF